MQVTSSPRIADVRLPAVAVVALLVVVPLGELVVANAIEAIAERGAAFPYWLPQFGSVGETAVVYFMLFDFLKFVAAPVALVWLGYALGRRRGESADA